MPFRKPVVGPHRGVPREQRDTDEYDRHGVPRCKHCGGPTRYNGFSVESVGSPRVFYYCEAPVTPECQKRQALACSKDWTTLLPLWRTEEAYFALKESHSAYERAHHLFRTRYHVAANSYAMRPKRIGLPWQQLRANAALVVEWLRILHRQGWMGSPRRRNRETNQREHTNRGILGLRKLLDYRRRVGLDRRYGPKARLAISGELPPEERPQPPPGTPEDLPF
jgi:hypothetical protein